MHATLRSAIVARRKALKLSQTAAGARCTPPVCQQTASEMESGKIDPHVSTLEAYCRGLGLRVRITR